MDPVLTSGLFMDQSNIVFHLLPQFQPGLLFYAFQRSKWNLFLWVGDCDAARLGWVFELDVTASLADLVPAVLFDRLDDPSAVHATIYTH